ncbi:DsbA family protein [Paenibacillus whitsoniae]|uniref:DsbA family protein n=1 Tax=Paenibacillus whitsoniae TaxID=2496558 RepID=A0A3S0A6V3_9BACL|nr:thioredoxin domain-containing protein [Paenibacillus whitsoniae]RTE10991.1 DsbA family protein [Paenibacillus whitsoniae]
MSNAKVERNSYKRQLQQGAEKKKRIQRLMGWSLAIIVLAFISLIVYSIASPSSKSNQLVDSTEFQYEQQPALGSKDAPVKIVEFADFKCPACMQFDKTILPKLKKDFIDSGIVQLHFINFPIISPNGDSRTAALAGEAVYRQNPEAFWKFYEAVYAKQGDEQTNWATVDTLVQIAKDANLKLDWDKLKRDIDQQTYAQDVKSDEAIAAKLGVNSTPTVYINGRAVATQDTFNYNAIKEAIGKAQGESAK